VIGLGKRCISSQTELRRDLGRPSVYAFNGSTGGLEIVPAGWAYAFDDNSNANVSAYTSLDGISFRVP
jgi:hypothetical protein